MYPVTAGGGGRGSSQNVNLTQGTFVFGFFIDGEDAQLPVIMGVLGNNDYNAVMKNVTPVRFIPFDGYPMNDEVMGEKRSTLQIRSSGGEVETQDKLKVVNLPTINIHHQDKVILPSNLEMIRVRSTW